jgi:hypothetical protein
VMSSRNAWLIARGSNARLLGRDSSVMFLRAAARLKRTRERSLAHDRIIDQGGRQVPSGTSSPQRFARALALRRREKTFRVFGFRYNVDG